MCCGMFDQNFIYPRMRIKLLSLLLLALGACNSSPRGMNATKDHNNLNSASWLIGVWVYQSPKGDIFESWKKLNDSLFVGHSYTMVGSDTITAEEIRLVEQNGDVNYIPSVPDQNMGLPVKFKLISMTDNELIFENPEHDFPQRILYQRLTDDSLVAEISGPMKGEHRSQRFPMHRAQ
jgi:hypothetical protein